MSLPALTLLLIDASIDNHLDDVVAVGMSEATLHKVAAFCEANHGTFAIVDGSPHYADLPIVPAREEGVIVIHASNQFRWSTHFDPELPMAAA